MMNKDAFYYKVDTNEKLFSIIESSELDKVNTITNELNILEIDSSFCYYLGSTNYTSNKLPYSYYMSSAEVKQLKENIHFDHNDKIVFTGNTTGAGWKCDLNEVNVMGKIKKKKVEINGLGDISFCLKDTMKLGDSYRALLIVSRELANEYIQTLIHEAYPEEVPKTTKDTMLLSKRIYASLLPVKTDELTILRSDLDSVKTIDLENKDYITWEWIVTPLKPGESKLVLKLSRVETPKGDLNKFFPSKIIPIHVSAITKTFYERLAYFWDVEWKWILTSIVAIIAWVLVYKQNQERKRREKTEQQQDVVQEQETVEERDTGMVNNGEAEERQVQLPSDKSDNLPDA